MNAEIIRALSIARDAENAEDDLPLHQVAEKDPKEKKKKTEEPKKPAHGMSERRLASAMLISNAAGKPTFRRKSAATLRAGVSAERECGRVEAHRPTLQTM